MSLLLQLQVLFCESTAKKLGFCIFGWTKVPWMSRLQIVGLALQIHCVSALGAFFCARLSAVHVSLFHDAVFDSIFPLKNIQKAWVFTSHHESKSTYWTL